MFSCICGDGISLPAVAFVFLAGADVAGASFLSGW
jgi:hypothetical protein